MDDPGGGGPSVGPPGGVGSPSGGLPVPKTSSSSRSNVDVNSRVLKTKPTATETQLKTYYDMFTSNKQYYDKFFTITSAEDNRNLTEINTIKANKDLLEFLGGQPPNVKELRSGAIQVEVSSLEQSSRLTKLQTLAGCRVKVTSNDFMNQSKGTIYYQNGPKFTDNEIVEAINEVSEVKVTDIYRMKKKVDNVLTELPIYLLTFQSTVIPGSVKIGWTRCSVRLYFPRPRRCFKCQEFGHGIKTCRSSTICMQCGTSEEDDVDHAVPCRLPAKCPNCNGPHAASSHDCPRYLKEQKVLNLQVNERVSYSVARRKVFASRFQETRSRTRQDTSFSQAVQSNVIPTQEAETFSPSPIITTRRPYTTNRPKPQENNRKRPLSDSSCPNNNKQTTPEPSPIERVCCPAPSVLPNSASQRTPPDLQCMKRPDNLKKNNKNHKSGKQPKRDH